MATVPLMVHGSIDQSPEAIEKWFDDLPQAKPKLTKLHLYIRDIVSGGNPTVVQIAEAKFNTRKSMATGFGGTFAFDDPITTGPEFDSKIIGRAQGTYTRISQSDSGVLMLAFNLVFTEGEYNGSTISFLCTDSIFHKYRELPIIGGSSFFRLAQGIATEETVNLDPATGDALVEYNVFILHY
ncbi:OLC1v1019641C1 [Oldenlandia corymbosa var. corymbosa]|uniref:Dirigent protein n=1 Tax=Oldenlandia corymbosa var. corymbosa TaxID=529605 RepID=A0AAV1EEW2_OLDCO|nr:OLC1v1019641C1 [Oldenlandia corymbosa var. corymbosa]